MASQSENYETGRESCRSKKKKKIPWSVVSVAWQALSCLGMAVVNTDIIQLWLLQGCYRLHPPSDTSPEAPPCFLYSCAYPRAVEREGFIIKNLIIIAYKYFFATPSFILGCWNTETQKKWKALDAFHHSSPCGDILLLKTAWIILFKLLPSNMILCSNILFCVFSGSPYYLTA